MLGGCQDFLGSHFLCVLVAYLSFTNVMLFGKDKPRVAVVFDNIVAQAFLLCNDRCKKDINWVGWFHNI